MIKSKLSPTTKVLIIIEDGSFTYDRRIQQVVESLKKNNYDLTIICPKYEEDPLSKFSDCLTICYYPVPSFPNGIIGHILEYIFSFIFISILTLILSIKKNFDIIHICSPPVILFPIGCLFKIFGRKYIIDMHDLSVELFDITYTNSSKWLRKLVRKFEYYGVKSASHVFITSEMACRRITNCYKIDQKKQTLIRNGIQLKRFFSTEKKHINENKINVTYIGNINFQDGVDLLLKAASYILKTKECNNVEFTIIGDGNALPRLHQLAKDLRIENSVEFYGRCLPSEIPGILDKADICVQPDPCNKFNDTCLMSKTLEYMAAGKPVVSFKLQETTHFIGDKIIYADGNCPAKFAEQIILLINKPELRLSLGRKGRKFVSENASWYIWEKNLLKVYRSLL